MRYGKCILKYFQLFQISSMILPQYLKAAVAKTSFQYDSAYHFHIFACVPVAVHLSVDHPSYHRLLLTNPFLSYYNII